MANKDVPTREALRARGPHVILVQHLKHAAPHHPGDDPEAVRGEDEGRQDEMFQGVGDGIQAPRQEPVEHDEARHERRRRDACAQPSGRRRPSQLGVEHQYHDQAQPEDRGRGADEREHAADLVHEAVAAHGREDPERDPDQEPKDDSDQGEFDRRGQMLP